MVVVVWREGGGKRARGRGKEAFRTYDLDLERKKKSKRGEYTKYP